MYILYICLTLYFQFQTINLTTSNIKNENVCFGSNEIKCMSYPRQQHATGATLLSDQCKKHVVTGKQSVKAIVLALSMPPTVHLVTKVTECFVYIHRDDSN